MLKRTISILFLTCFFLKATLASEFNVLDFRYFSAFPDAFEILDSEIKSRVDLTPSKEWVGGIEIDRPLTVSTPLNGGGKESVICRHDLIKVELTSMRGDENGLFALVINTESQPDWQGTFCPDGEIKMTSTGQLIFLDGNFPTDIVLVNESAIASDYGCQMTGLYSSKPLGKSSHPAIFVSVSSYPTMCTQAHFEKHSSLEDSSEFEGCQDAIECMYERAGGSKKNKRQANRRAYKDTSEGGEASSGSQSASRVTSSEGATAYSGDDDDDGEEEDKRGDQNKKEPQDKVGDDSHGKSQQYKKLDELYLKYIRSIKKLGRGGSSNSPAFVTARRIMIKAYGQLTGDEQKSFTADNSDFAMRVLNVRY